MCDALRRAGPSTMRNIAARRVENPLFTGGKRHSSGNAAASAPTKQRLAQTKKPRRDAGANGTTTTWTIGEAAFAQATCWSTGRQERR
jgi:hypothetical protein